MIYIIKSYRRIFRGYMRLFYLFLFMSISLVLIREATSAGEEKFHQGMPYREGEVRTGDRCVVSGELLDPDDFVVEIRGRRIPVKAHCYEDFWKNPDKYFTGIQPRGALFNEDMHTVPRLNLAWFFFGLYVLAALIFAAVTSHAAVSRGLAPVPWFFIGLAGTAFGYLAVLARKSEDVTLVPSGFRKVPATRAPVRCEACGNENHPAAKKCLGCGKTLAPAVASEVDRARRDSS